MNLSVKQLQIVEANDKYMYVLAGAGSGKTRTLTERIIRLLSNSRQGERVLAITFSNKAANELKERLLLSFTKEQLADQVYVGTIHNFCMELVLQRGSTIGLPEDLHIFESMEDRLEIFKEALDNVPQMKARYLKPSGEVDQQEIKSLFEHLSKAKRDFKFPADYAAKPLSQRLYQEYNDLMLAQNAIDFDDILLYAYRIMSEKPSVARIYQRIYKHICVDEAQDLNKAQYSVIKSIAGDSSSILMVGDPNQAIYGFNGSSSRYMCNDFPNDFPSQKYVLFENFRSSQEVIRAAKIIEPTFEMEGQLPIKGDLGIYSFEDEASESSWVTQLLTTLLSSGHPDVEGTNILPEQCAILARNKYVFSSLIKKFEEQNIDYCLRASTNQGLFSESLPFKLFDLGLRVLMNKNDTLHFIEMLGLVSETIERVENFAAFRSGDAIEQSIGAVGAASIKSAWSFIETDSGTFRFDKALAFLNSYCSVESNFSDDNERSLVYNDYLAWVEHWNIYIKSSTVEDRNLAHMMRSIALGVTNITKESGVTLSTVHMSKGLEFDVVFIIGLNEGVFPDYRAIKNADQLAEEQHNMFVAITRSKRLCYLTYPSKRVMPWGDTKQQVPSRYLSRISAHITEGLR